MESSVCGQWTRRAGGEFMTFMVPVGDSFIMAFQKSFVLSLVANQRAAFRSPTLSLCDSGPHLYLLELSRRSAHKKKHSFVTPTPISHQGRVALYHPLRVIFLSFLRVFISQCPSTNPCPLLAPATLTLGINGSDTTPNLGG